MTLASFFVIGIICSISLSSYAGGQSSSASPAPTQTSPSTTPPTTPEKSSAHKLRHHKRAKLLGGCATATSGTGPDAVAAKTSDCPPAKKVVDNGGTAEPSIQLTGDDTPRPNDPTAQALAATDENLKKLSALQLTASQQEIVSQIHQFVDESKAAVTAGDAERARTLALKAQTLSEELTKPMK